MTTNDSSRRDAHRHHPGTRLILIRPMAILAGLLLALSIAGPVAADAALVTSSPEDGAVLGTPPTTITLTFSEGLDAGKSSFKLLGAGIFAIGGTGKAAEDGADVMTLGPLVQDGRPLGPGVYQVQWTSVAGDGHLIRGTLTFTVADPTPAPTTSEPSMVATKQPAATPAATPAAAATGMPTPTSAPGELTPVPASSDELVPVVVGLVAVAAIGALILRRSRKA